MELDTEAKTRGLLLVAKRFAHHAHVGARHIEVRRSGRIEPVSSSDEFFCSVPPLPRGRSAQGWRAVFSSLGKDRLLAREKETPIPSRRVAALCGRTRGHHPWLENPCVRAKALK
jgi:hypothetical protein